MSALPPARPPAPDPENEQHGCPDARSGRGRGRVDRDFPNRTACRGVAVRSGGSPADSFTTSAETGRPRRSRTSCRSSARRGRLPAEPRVSHGGSRTPAHPACARTSERTTKAVQNRIPQGKPSSACSRTSRSMSALAARTLGTSWRTGNRSAEERDVAAELDPPRRSGVPWTRTAACCATSSARHWSWAWRARDRLPHRDARTGRRWGPMNVSRGGPLRRPCRCRSMGRMWLTSTPCSAASRSATIDRWHASGSRSTHMSAPDASLGSSATMAARSTRSRISRV